MWNKPQNEIISKAEVKIGLNLDENHQDNDHIALSPHRGNVLDKMVTLIIVITMTMIITASYELSINDFRCFP